MNIKDQIKLSSNVAVISGIFCTAVALLLLLNFWQLSKNDPLESTAMKVLIERLAQEPSNAELKQDIRQLDLLARKAYFNTQWQINTGSYLLLFGAIVFAIALRYYYTLKSKIEIPEQVVENELAARALSMKWLLATGAVILVSALAASYASVNYLDQFGKEEIVATEAPAEDAGIEVVEVGEEPVLVSGGAEAMPTDSLVAGTTEESGISAQEVVSATVAAAAPALPGAPQVMANHPAFRGPFGNGVSNHKNIPTDFDGPSGRNILWKTNLPVAGNSSPVIWGNRLFLSGGNAQKREVYCIDRNSGKILWTKSADNIQGSPASPPKTTEDTGLAAPSLATDGIRVYAIFGTGDVISFDMDGNRVWARNLGVPDNHYGFSSSLIAWKDKLYVQYDNNRGQKLVALDVATGNTVWETARTVKISWASPIMANVGGKYQVILAADPSVAGYDADTGKELWNAKGLMGEVGPSPAYSDGLVFVTQEYATLMAVNATNGQVVWKDDMYLSEVASPVAAKGMVFVATSYGVLAAFDTKTGEMLWEHDSGVGFYSSPVIAEDKIFLFDTDGKLQVFALAREMNLLAESDLGAGVHTTPAFAEGRMYVRAGNTLYCIGK